MKKVTMVIALTLAVLTIGTLIPTQLTASATGWEQQNGAWFYIKDNGTAEKGWKKIDGVWYFFHSDGSMATGWIQDGNNWYYLDSNGAMKTGWLDIGKKSYYLGNDGAMRTGWLQTVNGTWYFLKSNGEMAKSETLRIGGVVYEFSSNGTYKTTNNKQIVNSANIHVNNTPDYRAETVNISPHQVWYQDGKLYANCFITNGLSNNNVFNLRDIEITLSNAQGTIASAYFGELSNKGYISPNHHVIWTFIFPSSCIYNQNADLTGTITYSNSLRYSYN